MPNARIQNIPPSSPTSIVLLRSNFPTRRTMSSPSKIKRNAFDRFIKMSPSLRSKFVVLIKIIENSIPTTSASTICKGGTLNSSKMNISAPVDINRGGKMIFFVVTGFFAAFDRTINASVPMNNANAVEPIIRYTGGTFVKTSSIKAFNFFPPFHKFP